MNKKYFPYLALIAAVLFFIWIKKNQSGKPAGRKTTTEMQRPGGVDFDRRAGKLVYSKHARCRMDCRHIDESEVQEILEEGRVNESKIENSSKGVSYPLEGKTHDGQQVRVVFARHEETMVVVTVIDLDKDWACDCGSN